MTKDKDIEDAYKKAIDKLATNPSMFDEVYYCLFCDSIASKLSKNTYCCTLCGFTWEILENA